MSNEPNPKKAYGDRKAALQLVPPALEIGAAVGLKEGAGKYGAYNWRSSKVENMTYIGAIKRHALAYLDGEDVDPESTTGKTHLQGIAANVAILLDATEGGFMIDNRPPPGPAPRLLLTPKVESPREEGAEPKPRMAAPNGGYYKPQYVSQGGLRITQCDGCSECSDTDSATSRQGNQ